MSASATRILLLAYAGGAPATAIEEALAWSREARQSPHELHVLALPDAARRLRRDLLADGSGTGAFGAICRGLGLDRDEILFNSRTVHTLAVAHGPAAPPIDQVWQLLRALCRSADSVLTAVVRAEAAVAAVMIHAALQLVGRPADRMFVGVHPAGRRSVQPQAAGQHATASDTYVEIPILLAADGSAEIESYAEQAERRRQERRRLADPDPLTIDCRTRHLRVGATAVTLPPRQFFWVCVLARPSGALFPLADLSRALHVTPTGQVTIHAGTGSEHLNGVVASLRRTHAALFPHKADEFGPMLRRACGPHPGLPSTISKINAALKQALGTAAPRYLIEGGRDRGGYRLPLEPRLVRFDA